MDGRRSQLGKPSKGSPRRGNQKAARTTKKSKNVSTKTKSAQQPPPAAERSSSGKTRMVHGVMEYRSKNGWIPAVYHDEIRAQLVAQGPQGTYVVPRKRGKGAGDATSFHPDYRTNGPDRTNRHPILFRYEQAGYPVPQYTPQTWMHRGRIVLDTEDVPVLKWDEIPLVLSSEYEGYEMEVVRRLNPRISFRDFRARMPRYRFKAGVWKEAWSSSTLSMRNSRFRLGACCLAWAEREGSETIKAYIDELLPAHCLAANSTERFRDLTPYEVTQAQAPNKGKYPERAGPRALDETTRQQRNEAEGERSTKLLAEHHTAIGKAPLPALGHVSSQTRAQKRKRGETSLESKDEDENTRPRKRPAKQAEIVGATAPPANLNPSPQRQVPKQKGVESLGDEEQNVSPSQHQGFFFDDNIDPVRFGVRNSVDVGALFGDFIPGDPPGGMRGPDPTNWPNDDFTPGFPDPPEGMRGPDPTNWPNDDFTPGFPDPPEGIRGPDPANWPNDDFTPGFPDPPEGMWGPDPANGLNIDWEVLEYAVPNENFGVEGFGVGQDLDDLNNDQWQTFANEPSPPAQKPDFRFAAPQSVHDKVAVQYALFCTREDCRARLRIKTMPIRTSPEKCYASQWLEIQRRFTELWPLRGEGEAPVLVQLEAWTDNFNNWKE
ncbi:hypothetical protein MMC29_006360 [Sticta canariensis]|nr:hypothetical protein [Sticta canariensis]